MKKLYSLLIGLFFLIPSFVLTSCSKSGDLQQSTTTEDALDETARNHGCNPPPPPPPDCPPHHNCPATVPEATGISYTFTGPSLAHIFIETDVTYTNPDAAGTFRIVLRTVSGAIDSVMTVPALITAPNQTGTFHITEEVTYDDFPCTLYINGRPANPGHCPARSRISFPIDFNVSKG